MTRRRIPQSLRQRVVAESRNQCAYCHTLTSITGARLVLDHITPEAAGGQAVWEPVRGLPFLPLIVEARRRWAVVGWHPPHDDV